MTERTNEDVVLNLLDAFHRRLLGYGDQAAVKYFPTTPDVAGQFAAVLARMSPAWQPIETAPRNGDKFWCPRPNGKEILLVERFDSVALHSGIPNAVIYGATGKWWEPAVWTPYGALSPSPSTSQEGDAP